MRSACATRTGTATATTPLKPTDILGLCLRCAAISSRLASQRIWSCRSCREGSQALMAGMCSVCWPWQILNDYTQPRHRRRGAPVSMGLQYLRNLHRNTSAVSRA